MLVLHTQLSLLEPKQWRHKWKWKDMTRVFCFCKATKNHECWTQSQPNCILWKSSESPISFFFFNGQMRPFVSQMEKLQSFESETQKRIFRGNWSLFGNICTNSQSAFIYESALFCVLIFLWNRDQHPSFCSSANVVCSFMIMSLFPFLF